ncbi:phospholipase D-like domain-containing protein, partial [Sandarakinorhabdus rubra]|uniref:phospholipase D-like domain-containing protein n=1 Tax=Sandarakinorhabdus rubra TaxID=2672568 RepID=UPI001F42F4FE
AVAEAVAADFQRYWDSPAAVPAAQLGPAGAPPPPPAGADAMRAVYAAAAASPATAALLDEAGDFEWADVRMLSDPPEKISGAATEDRLLMAQVLAAIGPVSRRLLLVSAYFVPGEEGTRLLAGLAGQGLRVDVLTNSLMSNNVVLVHAWYAPWRLKLLEAGVRLWEMRGVEGSRVTLGLVPRSLRRRASDVSFFRTSASELHAKTLVVDGRLLLVGSMNFDPRSWKLNTEMGFLISSPVLAGRLEAALDAGLPHFAWALEANGSRLAWREGEAVLQTEPGTTALQRAAL